MAIRPPDTDAPRIDCGSPSPATVDARFANASTPLKMSV
jgi:hypothetical protein